MATRVRSFSKVNLGLRIGPVRPDGFHGLATMYQTLAMHDLVTVSARPAPATKIVLTTDHPRVPVDGRNTAWRMVELALLAMGLSAEVEIHLEKRLPVQGGMGAGSANAAAALIALEREIAGWETAGPVLAGPERLRLAAEVGSDVPLFLIGGAVLGQGRGELVTAMPDVTTGNGRGVPCVVAVPGVGISTPFAFREWDSRHGADGGGELLDGGEGDGAAFEERAAKVGTGEQPLAADLTIEGGADIRAAKPLTSPSSRDTLQELSLAYSSAYALSAGGGSKPGTSGIVDDQAPSGHLQSAGEGACDDLAGNTLLALVRTGIENDFEEVVFPYHPSLRTTKRLLMGDDPSRAAVYAALSGSGSALFGLYRSEEDARAAQQRVQSSGTEAILTETLTRSEYWARMSADRI